jgi:hypothetical protein
MKDHSRVLSADLFAQLLTMETDDHILWPMKIGMNGYGRFSEGGVVMNVHREALRRRVGEPLPGQVACHTPLIGCEPHCMNYRHLRWGSRADNMMDAMIDGVAPVGERHGGHKVTTDQVKQMRVMRARGLTYKQIAEHFPCTWYNVRQICDGKRWKHVA